ncbi:cystathionine gamma-synthase [Paracoccus sp. MA]|uniref:cystathionine gamma-synthase n=1 Tax=Paracoccus sp. MA TaxID=2895796 RepID=UPI001E62EE33|nr:cystathionine gamma-synthase [Paracoccus sp. MA]UFM64522.1 cystathionine gamma-synthase [Paracoccus sp. MA]
MAEDELSDRSIAAAHGVGGRDRFGAIVPPIYLSTSYAFAGFDRTRGYDYTRAGNPSRDLLAETLAGLEHGAGAVVTSSGMAALDLLLAQVPPGGTIVAPHDCYGGTQRLLTARRDRGAFRLALVDPADPAAMEAALAERPALLLIETPSNPLMRVTDIAALAALAHGAGAKVAVDNTFLSPALQQPLLLGADFVVHSTTKYLNGHSDVLGGAVVAARAEDAGALAEWANITGSVGSPFDAFLTLRGIRTLFARIAQQQASAMAVAEFLRDRPEVAAVHYPGLPEHPGHALAGRQQRGFGAMLSFELRGGLPAVRRFVEAVRVFTLADSLGGVESLIAHPATMTHVSMGAEARRGAGIGDGLLRLSVGLEDERDLLGGLDAGFGALGA